MPNPSNKESFDIAKMTYLLVSMVMIVIILVYSAAYAIPFVIALIVWFIIHELRENLQMIPFIRDKWPVWVQSIIAFIAINAVIVLIVDMLFINMSELSGSMDIYGANLILAMNELNQLTGIDVSTKVTDYVENTDFTNMISSLIDTASVLVGDAMLIPIYVLFLLIEENIFHFKLEALYPSKAKQRKTVKLFEKMDHNISRYMTLKTVVSFMTGLLSYFVLLMFGIDAPLFWAMLIFVLNYIPTIGSLIATLFPAAFAVLHFGELMPFFYILLSVGMIQVIVGNIIEPKIMGNSLNISSLVVLLSLTVWGAIWGIMGMILSVPITVMMIIVFEEIPSLRFIAILLSEKGELNFDEEEV